MTENKFLHKTAEQYKLDVKELMMNPETRTPIVICVESSYGMRGSLARIVEELNLFCEKMKEDPIARSSVELCLISYGGKQAKVEVGFSLPGKLTIPALKGNGGTPLSDAAETALKMLEAKRDAFGVGGVGNQPPLMIFIGGGGYSDPLGETAQKLLEESRKNGVTVVCVAVGDRERVARSSLMELAPNGKVLFLEDLKMAKFFNNLSLAVQKSSKTIAGEAGNYEAISEWDDILTRDKIC